MINHTSTYWQNKVAAWLQESPVKIFDIKERDENAKKIQDVAMMGLEGCARSELIKISASTASGMTRAVLPVDFSKIKEISLNHPLVKNKSLKFELPSINLDSLIAEINAILSEDLSQITSTEKEKKAQEVFNYLFFFFNKRLRNSDKPEIHKLGALWDVIPADTRLPDHPIWHHLGLTSAIYSSLEQNPENISDENLSMVVYSITPVQDFIGKARKLRDYWTGSVILSYLAFVGITKVVEELGPDHILYPSLHNQALMDQWLCDKHSFLEKFLQEKSEILNHMHKDSKSIASFPNKFVFICNKSQVRDICKEIEEVIIERWNNVACIVMDYLNNIAKPENYECYKDIWVKTIDKYWKLSWASSNFATLQNEDVLKELLPRDKWQDEYETMKKFQKNSNKETTNYNVSNLYGTTHSLVQGLLAAGKSKPTEDMVKQRQRGEKCPLCGEHEVLHDFKYEETVPAKEYNDAIRRFWETIRKKVNGENDYKQVGKNERLCAVCSLKRFLPIALKNKKDRDSLLFETLAQSYAKNNFPSTTEMSAWEFLQTIKEPEKRNKIIENLHNYEFETNDENLKSILSDAKGYEIKYYAFLLMDGDKMGDLINGETTEAHWNNVVNENNKAGAKFLEDLGDKRRTINPALHSMISDSLNNFARYGVQPTIKNAGGRLIYAGGDDVCAILPLSTAFKAADEIRQIYQLSYGYVTNEGSTALLEGEQQRQQSAIKVKPEMAKIVMHLGHSTEQDETKISLSGAIIIAHHKTPLKEVIAQAHEVLDGVAKEKSGRNALAIRLDKRSGGSRDMWFKWEAKNSFSDDKTLTCRKSFEEIIQIAQKKELSSSLLYKIETLQASIEPLANDIVSNKELIVKLFEYEVGHSGYKNEAHQMAVHLAGLCVKRNKKDGNDRDWYNSEAAIIANFMAKSGMKIGGGDNE